MDERWPMILFCEWFRRRENTIPNVVGINYKRILSVILYVYNIRKCIWTSTTLELMPHVDINTYYEYKYYYYCTNPNSLCKFIVCQALCNSRAPRFPFILNCHLVMFSLWYFHSYSCETNSITKLNANYLANIGHHKTPVMIYTQCTEYILFLSLKFIFCLKILQWIKQFPGSISILWYIF